jgi:hypothetical protein
MTVTQLVKSTALGIAVLAASAFSAHAIYDNPAGEVVGAQISQQVSSQVSATLSSGISGGGGVTVDVASKSFGPSGTATAASPVTRYFEGGNRGRSAGAGEKKVGVWVLGSYSDIENDLNDGTVDTRFEGDIAAFVGGVDYRLTDRVVAGLALSYEDVDIDTTFNAGTIETSGIGLAPYAVFKLTDKISADINGSYTRLDTDTTRTNNTITGQFDSRRYTAGGNLNVGHSINKVFMNGSVGFLYINENQDSYTESNGTFVAENDISIGQGRVSGTVGYNFGKVQPFLTAQLQHEFWAPSAPIVNGVALSEDTTGYVVGGGVKFDISDSVSGTVSATSTEGRDDLSLYSISGRVRVKF